MASTTTDTTQSKQQPETRATAKDAPAKTRSRRLVSLESFQARYTNREDPWKYEWNNGVVE